MDRLIYTAMTGAKHSLEQQATVANNLANLSTTAFKAQLSAYRAVPVVGPNSATRTFVVSSTIGTDFTPGPLMQTGRPLDVYVNGPGWIAVRGADGKEGYTRDGGFQLSPNGLLQTRSGREVLGESGPIVVPPNNTVAIGGDVSTAAGAQGIVDAAVKNYGRLDVLVNNSGVYEFGAIEAVTEEHFHRHFNVNVLGLLLATQAAVKHLGEGGSIINIGSGVTRLTPANSAVYTGTKGAVDAITGVLAKELGPKKIRVNAINPGMVETEGTRSGGFIGSDVEKMFVAQTPLGRLGQPNDIAGVAVFLASDDSKWLTGEQLLTGGGLR